MVKTKQSILVTYQNQVNTQQLYIDTLKKKLNTMSLSRLGCADHWSGLPLGYWRAHGRTCAVVYDPD